MSRTRSELKLWCQHRTVQIVIQYQTWRKHTKFLCSRRVLNYFLVGVLKMQWCRIVYRVIKLSMFSSCLLWLCFPEFYIARLCDRWVFVRFPLVCLRCSARLPTFPRSARVLPLRFANLLATLRNLCSLHFTTFSLCHTLLCFATFARFVRNLVSFGNLAPLAIFFCWNRWPITNRETYLLTYWKTPPVV
jgi:hypothetical protein